MRRYRIANDGLPSHFITCRIVQWLPVFISDEYCKIIVASLQYCREHKGLLLWAYVIMPTHLHLVGAAREGYDLSNIMRDFRRHTSKAISNQLSADKNRLFLYVTTREAAKENEPGAEHKVWATDFHPEVLHSEKFFWQKVKCLHDNPVRKGLVAASEHWLYSSANYYLNGEGPLEIDTE